MEVAYRIRRPLALEVAFRIQGFTALLGPSGAGKTTVLKALAGLVPADGRPWGGLAPERRPIGYLPQGHLLFPHLSALENVLFGLQGRGPDRRERALALLERFGLRDKADRLPRQLSGGEQQRVALARALARAPELLLLDEPTANLDAPARRGVLERIQEVVAEDGVRALVATHDPELAQAADWVIVLYRGRVLEEGEPLAVYTRPKSLTVARLTGFENLFPGRVAERTAEGVWVETASGRLRVLGRAVPPGTPVVLGIRPEEVLIVREDRPLDPGLAANVREGRLVAVRPRGAVVWARLALPGLRLSLLLPRHVQDRLRLQPGEQRRVVLKPRYLQLFSAEEEAGFSSSEPSASPS